MEIKLKPFGFYKSLLLFGSAAIILFIETNYLIPYLTKTSGIETVIWWFVVAGLGMFIPLVIIAILILRNEKIPFSLDSLKQRLRFRKLNSTDWFWTIGGILAIGIFSLVIMESIEYISGPIDHQPPFMKFEPLDAGRYWILAVWFPYWIFNIMGEEILWRGVVLPRQEIPFGRFAWLVNGCGWALFHIAFGWQLFLTLIPILLILPYVTQKRKNSWIAVIMHAIINGPSFIAISFGLL
jgi:membrane protease YdiL (CAAX protease family)